VKKVSRKNIYFALGTVAYFSIMIMAIVKGCNLSILEYMGAYATYGGVYVTGIIADKKFENKKKNMSDFLGKNETRNEPL